MADSLARAQLARAALELGRPRAQSLPPLVLVSDDERLPDPLRAVRALPSGSLVVVRSRDPTTRQNLACLVATAARECRLRWIVADDGELASRAGADGVHFPAGRISGASHWRSLRPGWFITCAAHSLQDCLGAARAGAGAILLAPVFATSSHPGAPHLGNLRARAIARVVPLPVYALGGIDRHTVKRLTGAPLAGLAAIGALTPE